MCLAIPGQIVEITDEANRLAQVDVAGVRRTINVGLLDDAGPGDWVLIHVGFALSLVDEEEAHATLALLQEMGAEYEQELAELQASRSSDGLRARGPLHHLLRRGGADAGPADPRPSGLADCAGGGRHAERGGCRPWSPVAAGDIAAGARRRRVAVERMKFVDEFRDAELGRALAGEILAAVEPGRHYKLMEVCGGHTHSIYKYGVDDLLPGQRRAGPRPGLPGMRDPDGPRR